LAIRQIQPKIMIVLPTKSSKYIPRTSQKRAVQTSQVLQDQLHIKNLKISKMLKWRQTLLRQLLKLQKLEF